MRVTRIIAVLALGASLVAACSGGGGSSTSAFCKKAKAYENNASLNSANASMGDIVKAIKDLEDAAPSEIKGSVTTLREYLEKAQKDPSVLTKTTDQKKLSEASDKITKFGEDKCGIKSTPSS